MIARKLSGTLVMSLALTAGQGVAAPVFEVNFDSADGSGNIAGVVGGTATILNSSSTTDVNPSIATSSPLASGGGGYLTAPGDNSQGAVLSPQAANSFQSFTTLSNGHRVFKGGFDFFVRTAGSVYSGTSTGENYLRVIDFGSSSGNALRIILNSEPFNSVNQELRVSVFNTGGGFSAQVPASGTFQIAANTTYHLGVTFEHEIVDGVATGNSQMHLFGIAGGVAIDTTDKTSTNPAYLASSQVWNPTNENLTFASGNINFGKLNSRANGSRQDFDAFRIYSETPSQFAAIPEPAAVGVVGALGAVLGRRGPRRR